MERGIAAAALLLALFGVWWITDRPATHAVRRGNSADRNAAGPRGAPDVTERRGKSAESRTVKRRIGEAVQWLDVIVVDPDGNPRAGVPVWLRRRAFDERIDASLTDDEGRVRFEPRPGKGRFDVLVDPGSGFPPFRTETWDADLERFDPLRVVLQDELELRLNVTVDGRPGLPRGFRLHSPQVLEPEFDHARGEVRGRIQPGALGRFEADAPGLLLTHRSIHRCTHEVCEADLAFSSRIDVKIRLLGKSEFVSEIVVQRPGLIEGWRDAPGDTDIEYGGDEPGEVTVLTRALSAGRFRIATRAGVILREFELLPSSHDVAFDLDLRNASWAEPRVVLPEQEMLRRFGGLGEPICYRVIETGLSKGTDVRILHPGDRTLTFTADVPLLEPDPGRGTVRTEHGGRFDLIARLAPLVRFRWSRPAGDGRLSVFLYRDGERLHPSHRAVRVGESFCFAAPPAGTYDLVVWHWDSHSRHSWPPGTYRGVRIDGNTDLGTLRAPEAGCSWTVVVRNPPRPAARDVEFLLADPPFPIPGSISASYGMFVGGTLAQSGATSWTRHNVPPGLIRVRLRAGDQEWTREIESDGKTDRTIEIDCAAE